MILDKKKGVIRILPRHLNKILEEGGGKADVAMLVGVHPAIFLAAALSANYEVSEYDIANVLLGEKMELVEMENGIMIPKGVETVLLGTIDVHDRRKEGPFVDITGTYDAVREEPIISFEDMLIPSNGVIFQALLPAGREHKLFMGMPQEIKIILNLKRIGIEVNKINLTDGGCAYFHCIVSIKKKDNDDGLKVIKEVFNVAHSIKLVTVVDDDINPFDYGMVEWALATRFQANRGLEVIHNQRGSSLDPSSSKTAITSKVGIDATLPLNVDRSSFRKARIL
jgi:UbiD family decarboxylase